MRAFTRRREIELRVFSRMPRAAKEVLWKTGGTISVPPVLSLLTPVIVILTEFMNFVVVAKVAMVAIFPNVAGVGIEERVVTPAV